ncbi:MAG: hypothetical protein ACE5GC_03690 [Acidimicrobiia bacterium]
MLRRKWYAAAVGTILATASFWLIVLGARDETGGARGAAVAFGLIVLVLAYMGLVAVSRTPRPLFATLLSLVLFIGVFILVILLGLVTGYSITFAGVVVMALGVGGVAALSTNGADVIGGRLWAVAVVTIITWGLLLIAPPVGVVTATVLPFGALAVVDMWVDRSLT